MHTGSQVKIQRPQGARPLVTVLYLLSALCEGFDVQAAGVAATGLTHELHCTPADLGLFFSASGMGLLLGAVIGGRTADRRGRKLVLVASIGVFGVFSLLTAIMPSLSLLVAARFLTGLGLGGALPNLIAMAVETSGSGVVNRNVGIAYIGMPIGGAMASILAFLIPFEAWRALFWMGGLAPLLIVPALNYGLPETRSSAVSHPRTLGLADSARLFFGESRAVQTLLIWLGFFLIVLTLHLILNWLPFLLVARGLSKNSAMLAQAAFSLGGALIALKQAAVLDSSWRSTSILVSIGMLPLVVACAAVLPPWPTALVLTTLLLGGAVLAQQLILYVAGSTYYPDAVRGTGLGAAIAAGRLGSLAGPLFSAILIANGRSATEVLLALLPIVLVCGVCVGLVSRTGRSGRSELSGHTFSASPMG